VDPTADNQLMQKVRDGDAAQLSVLFERHHKLLFNFFLRLTGNRELSEDLVQEVFLRMLKYRHTYRADSQFKAWMYQIARNAHIDSFRKVTQELPLDEGEDSTRVEPMSPKPIPDEALQRKQEVTLLRQALAKLPREKREVLVLSRFQELKYEEIAEIMACDVGTVKVRVFRAVKELAGIFFKMSRERILSKMGCAGSR
jgi:RNA polymerase sigma-70 factor (ECF subfamily)